MTTYIGTEGRIWTVYRLKKNLLQANSQGLFLPLTNSEFKKFKQQNGLKLLIK